MTQILNVLISYLARMTLFFLLSLTSPCIPNLASKTTVKESARLRLLLCVLNTSVSSTSSLYDDVGMPWRVIRTWPSNWTLPSRPPVLCVNSTIRGLTRLFFWYLPSLGRLEMKRCSYWTLRVNSQRKMATKIWTIYLVKLACSFHQVSQINWQKVAYQYSNIGEEMETPTLNVQSYLFRSCYQMTLPRHPPMRKISHQHQKKRALLGLEFHQRLGLIKYQSLLQGDS